MNQQASQKENPNKPQYQINPDKTVTILDGKFTGVRIKFSNFSEYNIDNDSFINYDYHILEGEIEINDKDIMEVMMYIIQDILKDYEDKED